MAGGDDVNRTRRRDVRDDRADFLSQTNLGRDRKRHLFRKWLAKIADDSKALAIGVMREADGGAARLNHRTKLGHSFRLGLGSVREWGVGIVVNCEHFAPQFRQPLRTQKRASAVAAIDG